MFLSALLIDVGDNPDRHRPGRLWLRNMYHVHQRLCMAFPSQDRISVDADFLAPFKQIDFEQHIHVKRDSEYGFLFRIDQCGDNRAMIIVQSARQANWEYAFHNAGYLLAAPCAMKEYNPSFSEGQCLRFRLMVNPVRRLSKHSQEADGTPVKDKSIGKRVPVQTDQLFEWLNRKAESLGFTVNREVTIFQTGYVYFQKSKNSEGRRLRSVRYDGILTVTNPKKFIQAIESGIGSGKAFGFGLLSVIQS